MKRLACAFLLTGATAGGLLGAAQQGAKAAPARPSDKLLLSILTPDTSSIEDKMSLDVSYRGAAVVKVELYLDNALVAQRPISASETRGIISFSIDTVLLSTGTHQIAVKAYSSDGNSTIASSRVNIPAADLSAPVRIAYPQNGTQVYGVVPIRISVDPELQKLKPYVTFFVDKELKVLRNYPPYEYDWDTTRVPNGWHLVEAWTSTADAITPTKARPVHVNVNNAGGETHKQNAVEDLRTQQAAPAIEMPIRKAAAQPAAPGRPARAAVNPATARLDAQGVRPGIHGRSTNAGLTGATPYAPSALEIRSAEPSSRGFATTAAPGVNPVSVADSHGLHEQLGPRMAGGAAVQPGARMMIASRPKDSMSIGTLPPLSSAIGASADFDNTTTVRPNETLSSVSSRTGVSAAEIARLNALKPGAQLKPGASLIVPRGGSFDVAFDGTPIVFDVRPRIEGGVKLAPFRQIFEHTGGRLYWFGGSAQLVRAVNDTREIEIKIGDKNATVNNHAVSMEHKPFIESGRTIVPLTFIRDSMGVKISYDRASGRLLIESK